MRELCIQQQYVPEKCQLIGMIVFALVQKGEDPCAGCNHDRKICGGRPNILNFMYDNEVGG
jgi:hypothetical protein